MIEAQPVKHDFSDEFEVFSPDPWAAQNTPEGLTAAMQRYDNGLCLGRHRAEQFYAIMWRPSLSCRGWSAPDISRKPVVVWELRREWGDGRAFELGPWIMEKIIKVDTWRDFRDKKEYARAKHHETTERLAAEERAKTKQEHEIVADITDMATTVSRAARTISVPVDLKRTSQHECSATVPGNTGRRAVH